MKFTHPIPVLELAQRFHAQLIGDETLVATGINEIHKVQPGDIAFSDLKKYFDKTLQSVATVILLNEVAECPPGKVLLIVEKPFDVYDAIVREHRPFEPLTSLVSHRSEIHPTTIIEPGVVIAPNVKIGAHCYLQANCYIGEYTILGDHVHIGPGTVVGSDAFYFKKQPDGSYQKWRSCGRVLIEDHVDIGANCTVNKGVSGDTVIGQGSKLDCLVHIGHGAVIGKNCLLAGQVGIGGKTILEDNVVLYGQVGVTQNLRIGKGAVVYAQSGVATSLEGGKSYFGSPAGEAREKFREVTALKELPELIRKVK